MAACRRHYFAAFVAVRRHCRFLSSRRCSAAAVITMLALLRHYEYAATPCRHAGLGRYYAADADASYADGADANILLAYH